MTRSRRLQPQEKELWDKIARNIRPLAKKNARAKITTTTTDTPQAALQSSKTQTPDIKKSKIPAATAPSGKAVAVSSSLEPGLKRKITRGRKPIEASLDLHGLTAEKAQTALMRFIAKARRQDMRAVLVITGKGSRSSEGQREPGVLRKTLPHWLAEMADAVVAFEPAGPRHGGEGAWYVQLRAQKRLIK